MKRYLCIAIAFFSMGFGLSYAQQETEVIDEGTTVVASPVRMSLVTCASGDELYSLFGHSALRVIHPSGEDYIYNFGLFDFGTSYFYLKFMRGNLEYMLGIHNTKNFVESYQYDNRAVYEQELFIPENEKYKILGILDYLYKPENRYYYYRFLSKNCTTELRDLLFTTSESLDSTYLSQSANTTYRKMLNQYLTSWSRFGVNLILGSTLDRDITVKESMFLPEVLASELRGFDMKDGSPLVSKDNYLFEAPDKIIQSKKIDGPVIVCVILLLLVIVLTVFVKSQLPQRALFFMAGFTGLFMGVVSLITNHTELYANYNLLWCNPLFLVAAFASTKKHIRLMRITVAVLLLSILLYIVLAVFSVQFIEISFVLLIAALLISTIYILTKIFVRHKKQQPEISSVDEPDTVVESEA